eukprot:scaffold34933_cov243-Amphora_coffeaeformis.AAC.1
MTLTLCIGSSGSGKTTFLEDVYVNHLRDCVYLRQFHKIRPYIPVRSVPNFDPTALPYWDVYVEEGKDQTIQVGGTMAGHFTAGLSGGQRKLLLFELIYQRTRHQKDLLILLDEPFAGVTDDFLEFILDRLAEIKERHNVCLVTNDHIAPLEHLADNTLQVSARDRMAVRINQQGQVNRDKAIRALSVGDRYEYQATTQEDLYFFFQVEVRSDSTFVEISIFAVVCMILFIISFWNSAEYSVPFVILGAQFVGFLTSNPYFMSLVDWRHAAVIEESSALLHSSPSMYKALKVSLAALLLLLLCLLEYGCINIVVEGLEEFKFYWSFFFDGASVVFPLIAYSIYTDWTFTTVQIFGCIPAILMLFFSTTLSPGSGIEGIKALRYLFPRFYLWCMLPGVAPLMEGCPKSEILTMMLLCFTGVIVLVVFVLLQLVRACCQRYKRTRHLEEKQSDSMDPAVQTIQRELYASSRAKRPFLTKATSVVSSGNELDSPNEDGNNNV